MIQGNVILYDHDVHKKHLSKLIVITDIFLFHPNSSL